MGILKGLFRTRDAPTNRTSGSVYSFFMGNSISGKRVNERLKTEGGKTKRVYSSKYALSSIVYCGKCGDLFRRVAWKARGASYNKWRCASRIEKGPKEGCDADAISEVELQNAVVRAINKDPWRTRTVPDSAAAQYRRCTEWGLNSNS